MARRDEGEVSVESPDVAPEPGESVAPSSWARRPSPSLRHVKRSELLAREIVEEIVARQLQPGDVLPPESAMLAHYEVGRASLREALRMLEMQGLVMLKPGPGGGPVVGAVEPTNLGRTATLYFRLDGATCGLLAEAMLVLDPWLAELAAQRADREVAKAALGSCMMAADRVQGDVDGVWRTAPEFHDAVYQLSGNGVLKTVAGALGAIFRGQVLSQVDMSATQPRFLAEHHGIADAINAGDPGRARQLAHDQHRGRAVSGAVRSRHRVAVTP
jgi:GntR family transcriptional regulator, transcriptional repressor for pyruvate dehydrogenase complex